MQSFNIREHPSFIGNQVAVRLGIVAAIATAIATLTYPWPNNLVVSGCVAVLALHFVAIERLLLTRVKTLIGLDCIVIAYNIPILFLQWLAIAVSPTVEVSTGAACMIVISGLLYTSTLVSVSAAMITALTWIGLRTYLYQFPSTNEVVQLLFIAPILSIIARLTLMRAIALLKTATDREHATVLELRATLGKLQDEVRLREASEAHLLRARRNESLGLMAAGVAHDFNNTLAAIGALSEIIDMKSQSHEIKGYTHEIKNAVKQASGICRQMLTYTGRSTGEMSIVDLVALTSSLVRLLQASIPQRVAIQFETDLKLAKVNGNVAQLQQVLMNLITNGAEAIEGGGSVRVRLLRQRIEQEVSNVEFIAAEQPLEAGEYFVMEVTDSGSGIEPEILEQIFDPYYTTKGEGHGFGLSMVIGIAKSHNSKVQVQSQPSVGTTIRVFFQPNESEIESPKHEPTRETNDDKIDREQSILIVDDDGMVRSSLAQILKVHGWKVITAESGEQALQHIEAKMEFVAMIIDYKMPNMTGLETLRKIRELGCQTPAILCSGYVPETMEAIIAKEFHGYLPKPYQISELQELLRRIVAE